MVVIIIIVIIIIIIKKIIMNSFNFTSALPGCEVLNQFIGHLISANLKTAISINENCG